MTQNESLAVVDVTSTENDDHDNAWLRDVIFNIRVCFLPIVVAGTITNMLNFMILSRKDMRQLSTSVYLLALAIADVGVMYLELFRVWFEMVDFVGHDLYFTDTYCKVVNYTHVICRDFSNWLVACVTFERFVMVAAPHRAKEWRTVARARSVTLWLLVVISILHTHYLVFSTAQYHAWWVCWEDANSWQASVVTAAAELTVGYTVVIVVFFLNIALTVMLIKMKAPCLRASKCRRTSQLQLQRQRRLTRTLVAIAFMFMLCETPRIIVSFLCRFVERTPLRRIVLNASFVVSGINHASNFFVYILLSPRFRQIIVVGLCRKHATPPAVVQSDEKADVDMLRHRQATNEHGAVKSQLLNDHDAIEYDRCDVTAGSYSPTTASSDAAKTKRSRSV